MSSNHFRASSSPDDSLPESRVHKCETRLMNQSGFRIVFSEWLSTGIIVHFEGGMAVFFAAQFLYEQKELQTNQVFREDSDSGHAAEYCQARASLEEASWRLVSQLSSLSSCLPDLVGENHEAFSAMKTRCAEKRQQLNEAKRQLRAHQTDHGC